MIAGLMAPDGGSVSFGDRDITAMPMYERARLGVSYLPQEASVFRKLNVEENVRGVLEYLDIPRPEVETRLKTLLEELGVLHLAKTKAFALSGGEGRRGGVARGRVHSPR